MPPKILQIRNSTAEKELNKILVTDDFSATAFRLSYGSSQGLWRYAAIL